MPRWHDFLQRLRGDLRAEDGQRALAILGLNRQLATAASRQQVLTVLVDEAVRLFGAERGFLVTASPAEPGFVVEVARSLDREPVANAASRAKACSARMRRPTRSVPRRAWPTCSCDRC
jgi:hypothetical protein